MRSLFPYTHKTHTHTSMYIYMPVQVEITLQQALAGCHLEFPSLETNRPVTLALYDSVRMHHIVAVHGAVMHALQPDPFSPCAKLTCVPCVCVSCVHTSRLSWMGRSIWCLTEECPCRKTMGACSMETCGFVYASEHCTDM